MIKRYYKKVVMLAILVLASLIVVWLYLADFGSKITTEFGVTFSQKYASELNLSWQKTLTALLDELKVKKFRLVAYWDLIESREGQYNFKDLDWQLKAVADRNGQVILALGQRVPRWPECHWPEWLYRYNHQEQQAKVLKLVEETVNHFKGERSIAFWQVENEPFLKIFGKCPRPDKAFYKKEIALVKSLDTRPIVVTESGELSTWLRGAALAGQLGVSIYRVTWTNLVGYFYYPLPPAHYYLKSLLVKWLSSAQSVFVSEMQAEPWLAMPILQTSLAEQFKSMNPQIFKSNLAYARRTGLSPVYLWGAEWWYWLKEQGEPQIWQTAQGIFDK